MELQYSKKYYFEVGMIDKDYRKCMDDIDVAIMCYTKEWSPFKHLELDICEMKRERDEISCREILCREMFEFYMSNRFNNPSIY